MPKSIHYWSINFSRAPIHACKFCLQVLPGYSSRKYPLPFIPTQVLAISLMDHLDDGNILPSALSVVLACPFDTPRSELFFVFLCYAVCSSSATACPALWSRSSGSIHLQHKGVLLISRFLCVVNAVSINNFYNYNNNWQFYSTLCCMQSSSPMFCRIVLQSSTSRSLR